MRELGVQVASLVTEHPAELGGQGEPRAAANPSVISSTENWRKARW